MNDERNEPIASVSPDATPRIDADVPCIRCGYNLRTADLAGTCPECGHSVADSMRDDRLMFCDRRWSTRVGYGWIMLAMTHACVAVMVLTYQIESRWASVQEALYALYAFSCIVAFGSAVYGTIALQTIEPGRSSRPFAPQYVGLALIVCALSFMFYVYHQEVGQEQVRYNLYRAMLILVLAGWLCFLLYARALARRIPRAGIALIIGISWLALAPGGVVLLIGEALPLSWDLRYVVLPSIAGWVVVIGAVGAAVGLLTLGIAMLKTAKHAPPFRPGRRDIYIN